MTQNNINFRLSDRALLKRRPLPRFKRKFISRIKASVPVARAICSRAQLMLHGISTYGRDLRCTRDGSRSISDARCSRVKVRRDGRRRRRRRRTPPRRPRRCCSCAVAPDRNTRCSLTSLTKKNIIQTFVTRKLYLCNRIN